MSDADLRTLQVAWTDLQAHVAAFGAVFDKVTGSPAAAPDAAAATAQADALAAREAQLNATLAKTAQALTDESAATQATMTRYQMSGAAIPPQIMSQMIAMYTRYVAQFEASRPEAKALADAGRKGPLDFLDAWTTDSKTASNTFSDMIGQTRAFEVGKAQIWTDVTKSMTDTVQATTTNMKDTFERATKNFTDYLRS